MRGMLNYNREEEVWNEFYLDIMYRKYKLGGKISLSFLDYFKDRVYKNGDIDYFDFLISKISPLTIKEYFPILYSKLKNKVHYSLLEIYRIIYQIMEDVMVTLVDNSLFRRDYWRLYSCFLDLPINFKYPIINSNYDERKSNLTYNDFYIKYSICPKKLVFEGDNNLTEIWKECCEIIEEWNYYIKSNFFIECVNSIYEKEAKIIYNKLYEIYQKKIENEKEEFIIFFIELSKMNFEEKYKFLFPFHNTNLLIKFKQPNTEFFEENFKNKIDKLIQFSKNITKN